MTDQIVYIVTSGEYGDYGICAVFSNKEQAEEYILVADKIESEYHRIEEWRLNEPSNIWFETFVRMDKDGKVLGIWNHMANSKVRKSGFHYFDVQGKLVWCVVTDDREKAIKIVSERRAQIIAANIWGNENKVRQLFKG